MFILSVKGYFEKNIEKNLEIHLTLIENLPHNQDRLMKLKNKTITRDKSNKQNCKHIGNRLRAMLCAILKF